MVEEDDDVAENIIDKLVKEGLTREEIKKLVMSNNYFISNISKIIL